MTSTTTTDAVIIGAGVVGCSIALALARAGIRTVNVDPLPAPGYGSTSHSSAIIRPFYSHVVSCAVAHAARSRWLDWRDFLGASATDTLAQYRETGGLILFMEGQASEFADNLAAMDAVGVAYEILDTSELQRRLPGVSAQRFGPARTLRAPDFGHPVVGSLGGAIHLPAAGHVNDPQLAARNLHDAASAQGARFLFGRKITEVLQSGGKVTGVRLDDGARVSAPIVINAAGPHSAEINQQAGVLEQIAIRTRPHRHEVAYVRKPARMSTNELGFLADLDTGFYARSDGVDLLVGTTDPACDEPQLVLPDDTDQSMTDQWTLQVLRAAQRFPELAIESRARGTVGLYDVSDDWVPLYDKSPLPGFFLAIGTSGNQFKNAPMIGDIMLAIIQTELAEDDHDKVPAQLRLAEVDRTIDLAFYSRLRKGHTTRSVLA